MLFFSYRIFSITKANLVSSCSINSWPMNKILESSYTSIFNVHVLWICNMLLSINKYSTRFYMILKLVCSDPFYTYKESIALIWFDHFVSLFFLFKSRDASLIAVANSVTSFLFGFIIFSMLGFLAKTLGTDVPHVVKDGIGLLFIIIPQSIVGMSVPAFWSWMFFLMIFTVGFCSLVQAQLHIFCQCIDGYRNDPKNWYEFRI